MRDIHALRSGELDRGEAGLVRRDARVALAEDDDPHPRVRPASGELLGERGAVAGRDDDEIDAPVHARPAGLPVARDPSARGPSGRRPLTNRLLAACRAALRSRPARERLELGIGERVGNASIDQILVNLRLWGLIERDLGPLVEYAALVALHCGAVIPPNYPVLGADAFRTGTGVHAAAVIKALRKGDRALADLVYSAVPASIVGREQRIEVGPMSGESNVIWWLEHNGHAPERAAIERIFAAAKASDRLLTDAELERLARGS